MSYSSQAQLSTDLDFLARVSAAAAVEVPHPTDPQSWARSAIWRIAAAPGFAAAYESALVGNVPRPGNDPGVITDPQILAAVQEELSDQAPMP
jgi:hypothetical protein